MKHATSRMGLASVTVASLLALSCALCFPIGSSRAAYAPAFAATSAAPVAEYDFTSAGFDGSAWTKVGTTAQITEGKGLTMPTALADVRTGYAVANPLKGQVTEGFTVILDVTVADGINDYESLFGFNKTADPQTDANNFFYVAGSGSGVRLNLNGPTNQGNNYYDITGKPVLFTAGTAVEYALAVTEDAISVYIDNVLSATYPWTADGVKTAYSYDTLSFVNTADYFNIGIADSIWGNAGMTVRSAKLYDFTPDASLDFTALTAATARANQVKRSEYDETETGFDAAYAVFEDALSAAGSLSLMDMTQTNIDALANALNAAYDALEQFRKGADLTSGLIAAFPLDAKNGGKNLVGGSTAAADQVVYMTGANAAGASTETLPLTESSRFITYQGVSAAKLFDEEHMSTTGNANPYADRGAKSNTMGLRIPASAFTGATTQTGLTITVNVYVENFYSGAWGRIFQLGEYNFAQGGGQIFVAVNGNIASDVQAGAVISNSTNVGNILARQWYSVTLSFDPSANTIDTYISGYQLMDGAIVYTTRTRSDAVTSAQLSAVLGSIVSADAENWMGRSFWDNADASMIGGVSNLSIYNRALLPGEIVALHATSDLSALVKA